MYCPECGAEYREGFDQCSDCLVPLVLNPPQQLSSVQTIENLELVTLMEIENPICLAVVRSVLEAEGIASIVRGESPHALGGIDLVSRRKRAVLQIAKENEKRAKDLIEGLELPENEVSETE